MLCCNVVIEQMLQCMIFSVGQWLRTNYYILYQCFLGIFFVTKTPSILYKNLSLSSERRSHATSHAIGGNFTLPKARTNTIKRTVVYRAMHEWNLLPSHITQDDSKNLVQIFIKTVSLDQECCIMQARSVFVLWSDTQGCD